jgi:hypothetical protein
MDTTDPTFSSLTSEFCVQWVGPVDVTMAARLKEYYVGKVHFTFENGVLEVIMPRQRLNESRLLFVLL